MVKYRRTILYVLREKEKKICFLKIGALLGDLLMKDRYVLDCLLDKGFYIFTLKILVKYIEHKIGHITIFNHTIQWHYSHSPCCATIIVWVSSVHFTHSVMSYALWPHELQHARIPCLSSTPGVYPNPCPSSRWCHPTISSSVVPFSSCPQSFLASGSFQMSQLFATGGQSIGVSASASVLPMNTQDRSP